MQTGENALLVPGINLLGKDVSWASASPGDLSYEAIIMKNGAAKLKGEQVHGQ
jgi:hypothetical protein